MGFGQQEPGPGQLTLRLPPLQEMHGLREKTEPRFDLAAFGQRDPLGHRQQSALLEIQPLLLSQLVGLLQHSERPRVVPLPAVHVRPRRQDSDSHARPTLSRDLPGDVVKGCGTLVGSNVPVDAGHPIRDVGLAAQIAPTTRGRQSLLIQRQRLTILPTIVVEHAQVIEHPSQLCGRSQPPSDGQRLVQAGGRLVEAPVRSKRERQVLQ